MSTHNHEKCADCTAREAAAEQRGREDNALHEMCYVSGSKALEAREAAARREAEDDPKHALMYRALLERAEKAEAAVADTRREAWDEGVRAAHQSRLTLFAIRRVNPYALAEPERDEEGS